MSYEEIRDLIGLLDNHPKDNNWSMDRAIKLRDKLKKKLNYSDGNSGKGEYLKMRRKEDKLLREKYSNKVVQKFPKD